MKERYNFHIVELATPLDNRCPQNMLEQKTHQTNQPCPQLPNPILKAHQLRRYR
jgi:hypothetical protein